MTNQPIPKEVYHPFFFPEHEMTLPANLLQVFHSKQTFIHEIAFYSGHESLQPWMDPEQYIPKLLNEWKLVEEELRGLFQNRDKENILMPMKRGIGYLIESIYWSNGFPVSLDMHFDMNSLDLKPVNITERLQFLLARPSIYPSFIQLTELFEEQEKQFLKYIAIKKATKKPDNNYL